MLGGTHRTDRRLSTGEVARILGLREGQVRALVRGELCRPARVGRGYAFSFQDLVVLRTARDLMRQQVPAARVRRSLVRLRGELGADRPLSGLRIFADGREVAVQQGRTAWNPETGQTLLNFEVDELAERVHELRATAKPESGSPEGLALAAFERALELEEGDPARAAEAYMRAIELDPELVDAVLNLGRIVHEAGDPAEAVRLYQRALELAPDDPIIYFNLGLALEDTSGASAAAARYEEALDLDPDFADAHYNLAGLCEQLGRRADAVRHYHAYKKLTEG